MSETAKKFRIAIIGCGNIASVHAESIEHINGCTLVAAADIVPEKAKKFEQKYNIPTYLSMEEVLQHEYVDAVHICTPHVLHVPMITYGLQRGVHVFSEKPPIINREQYEKLKCIRSDLHLGFCFQNRYNYATKYVSEILRSGKYGKIIGARGFVTWHRTAEYYTESTWRGTWDQEGGGALINQGIHTLDLLNYLICEKPVNVDAMMGNHHLKGAIEVEDTMSVYIQYPSAECNLYVTTAGAADSPTLIDIMCEDAVIRMEGTKVTISKGEMQTTHDFGMQTALYGKDYWGSGHEACIRDFYDCIGKGTAFKNDLAGIRDTAEILLKCYEQARK